MIRRLASLLALAGAARVPASAAAAPRQEGAPRRSVPDATVKIKLGKLDDGRAEIYCKVPVFGTVAPFVAGQKVEVTFYLDGKQLVSRKLAVSKGKGGNRQLPLQRHRPRGRQVRGQRQARGDRASSAATAPCARAGRSASRRCTRASAATSSSASRRRCGRWATSPTAAAASAARPRAACSPTAKSTT